MKLRKADFERLLAENKLKIAFIGMSNVGKTRISKDMAKKGPFQRVEVDEMIGKRLTLASITSVATWLGFPYEPQYAPHESEYLALETEATEEAMSTPFTGNAVLDTTGSAVYLPGKTLARLKQEWLVISLKVQDADVEELFKSFIAHPKPVIWNGMFTMGPGEQPEQALERGYRALLKDRLQRYKQLADISIPRFALYKAKTADDILAVIKRYLPA
jgi:shikimate kinase